MTQEEYENIKRKKSSHYNHIYQLTHLIVLF